MTDSNPTEDVPQPPQVTIRLDHFLKLMKLVESGGQAKYIIQSGLVTLNGETCTARRKKLIDGDLVVFDSQELVVGID
ncbi:RNA-binding S4 domain-containing protein [Pirellulaceae bacterium]|jgi:ribosome-associated protein|nr:RNA-binding S4 domain-containing protein [Pirellulaceae bacterium]